MLRIGAIGVARHRLTTVQVAPVANALATAVYRAAQEAAAVAPSVVAPAGSVDRTHGQAVVEDLPAWAAVVAAVEDTAAVVVAAAVAVAVAVAVAAAEVAEGGNK